MQTNLMTRLLQACQSIWYWIGLIVGSIVVEAVALYYQYALDEWPCVLCIHVRIWLFALIFIALIGAFLRNQKWPSMIAYAGVVGIGLGLFERSWLLLGVERGTVFGACSMDSGLPDWFALDKWFPLLFEVQASCGYTPEIVFGITMAESLVLISISVVILGLLPILLMINQKQISN